MINNLSNLDDLQSLTDTSKNGIFSPLVEGSEYSLPSVQTDGSSAQTSAVSLDEISISTEQISVSEELEIIPLFDPYEPNDTYQEAYDVGNVFVGDYLATDGANIGAGDSSDFFIFNLQELSEINLNLSFLSADADLHLLEQDGTTPIAESMNGGNMDESIVKVLNPGTYYAEVRSWDGIFTDYFLEASAESVPPDIYEPNDTRRQAHSLGQVSVGDYTFIGDADVGGDDTSDFFKFRLKHEAEVNLNLSGLNADADLRLLRRNGSEIASSTNGGNDAESIVVTLDRGTYYVKVESFDGNYTDYFLDLFADGDPYEPNDTRQQAHNLGQVSVGDYTFIGDADVGGDDTSDFFKFRLRHEAKIDLNLSWLNADADLYLLDRNGIIIGSSTNGGNDAESIMETLSRGLYYVEVRSFDGILTEDYLLELSARGDIEPNNTRQQANNLGNVFQNDSVVISDGDDANIGDGDTSDFFKFRLKESTTVDILLSQLNADADLYLTRRNGSEIASSTNGGNDSESIIEPLDNGIYYIEVRSFDGGYTDYYLDILTYDDIIVPVDRIS